MADFGSETDSEYTNYWKDWVRISVVMCRACVVKSILDHSWICWVAIGETWGT